MEYNTAMKLPTTYKDYSGNSYGTNNCASFAIHNAFGIPFNKIENYFIEKGKRKNGGTDFWMIQEYIESFCNKWGILYKHIEYGYKNSPSLSFYTFNPDKKYLIAVHNYDRKGRVKKCHMAAIINGVWVDWLNKKEIEQYTHIHTVYEIGE